MSVPALRDPVPHTPDGPEKTITQLLTQWEDLTNAAIAATGHTEGWFRGPIQDKKPWDPAAEEVGLAPCATTTSDDASQVSAIVTHVAFEHDPHPIADTLTAYWESQGFTVTRTVDSTIGTEWMAVEVRAERSDGVFYGLTATTEQVGIDVLTECSADPSIHEWAEERVQRRLDSLYSTPTPSSAAETGIADIAADIDDRFWGF
ncbi:hypothetical protein SAMN04515691_1902 [Leifsonia sp. 98AMF]|nr:hypothetical protein SAMN04515690_2117 [Leifsonia sp. 197AMF]SDJ01275.1 hypothetical protein SAMN04515684_1669 [Leifsonia sp. 466MF]SDJ72490.1 hypothetical protein SAMN04515683_1078 [Leifsonia sp. 157MF]SDO04916.1 hypothetical protein SAMN04515686_3872 [Leifsonia sp. 509MF]SEM99258.1 hypothetical protein SAMN04515685_1064 [Leifsonia sp. 467MF]SFM20580.1 hypothetical protein SAMN04515691_1902 [Leifsonia sp. 98AMF]